MQSLFVLQLVVYIQSNPDMMTSAYTSLLQRQILCGTNYFLSVNRNIIGLGGAIPRVSSLRQRETG
jgi:hypothetical protein